MFGYRAVPNGLFISEDGILAHRHFGGFDIRKSEVHAAVSHFLETGAAPGAPSEARPFQYDHFERGLILYHSGDLAGARETWRVGVALEPQHWNMRKQLWAIENPDRFYSGAVDFDWQKQQIESGR